MVEAGNEDFILMSPTTPINAQKKIKAKLGYCAPIYEGEQTADVYDGRGCLIDAAGNLYEGYFKNGLRHGIGREFLQESIVYEGSFVNDKRHGKGLCCYRDGSKYEGDFEVNIR